jgi:prepilin-type N-terminal cleavage/methylation domain-containing protein|tara:strand:- start:706 stop:969 length:264 start_codon:yes stop_codon:yes gene_type:complete
MNTFQQKTYKKSKKIKAFTLIELIVVSSIMVLISATSVFYFIDFIHLQETEQKVQLLEMDMKKYDQSIKNKEIYDYTMEFNTEKSEQ